MHQVARFEPGAELLATFAGQYESVELDTRWTLAMDDGKLVLQPRRGAPVPLSSAFGDAFTGMGLLRFQRTPGGEIAAD